MGRSSKLIICVCIYQHRAGESIPGDFLFPQLRPSALRPTSPARHPSAQPGTAGHPEPRTPEPGTSEPRTPEPGALEPDTSEPGAPAPARSPARVGWNDGKPGAQLCPGAGCGIGHPGPGQGADRGLVRVGGVERGVVVEVRLALLPIAVRVDLRLRQAQFATQVSAQRNQRACFAGEKHHGLLGDF